MSGLFYGGVVGTYVATEKLSGGIRGVYDGWNAVPAAMMAGIGIGAKGAPSLSASNHNSEVFVLVLLTEFS